ncbi:MAG: putative lipid II flippase FtsW [Myxococcota bacterium]|jgi:cell division protein FtsW|nr:putative lipid II flippase FtsW [Myxococcota bacterium]
MLGDRKASRDRSDRRSFPTSESHTGIDSDLLISASVLIGFGVVMSYSTTAPLSIERTIPPLFVDHVSALAVGVLAATAAACMPLVFWYRIAFPIWFVGVLLLMATFFFGVEVNGAQRWLPIPGLGFRFQPVEPVKFATLIAVAAVVAPQDGRTPLSRKRALIAAGMALPVVTFLLLQPDLGNAVLVSLLVAMLLLVAGLPIRQLILPGIAGVIGLAAYIANNPYAQRRVFGFMDPWQDAQGAGFQLVQSIIAFNQGGLFGVGLGNGKQKLFYLPEAHTDFILSLVAEELGLVGVLIVFGAFAVLLISGTRIARRARSRFALLLAFAITSLLAIPAAVNAAVVMGMLPTKGLTLPFLSYGGTSIVICCTLLGVLLGLSRQGGPKIGRRGRVLARGVIA